MPSKYNKAAGDQESATHKSVRHIKVALTLIGIALFVGVVWRNTITTDDLATSTLKTSFSRLTSTNVDITIDPPGMLNIEAGPTAYLDKAMVFSLVIESNQAQITNDPPFEIGHPYEVILNTVNPSNSKELILSILFPRDYFREAKKFIARLPFQTDIEGDFKVKSVLFGSLPF